MVVWSNIFKYTVTSLIFDIQKCANNIVCFKLDFAPDEIIKLDIYIMLICIRVRVTAQKNACNLLRLNLRMLQSGPGDSLYLFHFIFGFFCIATPYSTSTGMRNFRALSLRRKKLRSFLYIPYFRSQCLYFRNWKTCHKTTLAHYY